MLPPFEIVSHGVTAMNYKAVLKGLGNGTADIQVKSMPNFHPYHQILHTTTWKIGSAPIQ